MSIVTLAIYGANDIWKLAEVRKLLECTRYYRKGTDKCIYVDLERSRAHLIMVNLNNTPGIRAEIIGQRSSY